MYEVTWYIMELRLTVKERFESNDTFATVIFERLLTINYEW